MKRLPQGGRFFINRYMTRFIKSLGKVIDVNIRTDSETQVTRVAQYTTIASDKSSELPNIEETTGDFEDNQLSKKGNFFIYDDNNPLVYGLKNLDRFAMIIANKSSAGVMAFAEQPPYSTADSFKRSSEDQAKDIALRNMGVYDAVKSGLRNLLPNAIAFDSLTLMIIREARRGNRVFSSYTENVFDQGKKLMMEWINNGY